MKEITLFIDKEKNIRTGFVENVPQDYLMKLKESLNLQTSISKKINESENPQKYFDYITVYVKIGYELAKAADLGQIPPLTNGSMTNEKQLQMVSELCTKLLPKHYVAEKELLVEFISDGSKQLQIRDLLVIDIHYKHFRENMSNLLMFYGALFYNTSAEKTTQQ